MKKHPGIFFITGLAVAIIAALVFFTPAARAQQEGEPAGSEPLYAPASADTGQLILSQREQRVIERIIKSFICRSSNLSIADSQLAGQPCPDGNDVLDLIIKLMRGPVTDDDYVNLALRFPQGRSIIYTLDTKPCIRQDRLQFDLFVMPYSTYGLDFINNTLTALLGNMGNAIDWTPYFIVSRNMDGSLSAFNGPQELEETLRQVCIRDKWGRKKWLEYAMCFISLTSSGADLSKAGEWNHCIEKAGIQDAELETCVAEESQLLIEKDMRAELMYSINSSPIAIFNCSSVIAGNQPYNIVKPLVCRMFSGNPPGVCSK